LYPSGHTFRPNAAASLLGGKPPSPFTSRGGEAIERAAHLGSAAVREQLRALDPSLAVFNTETMNEHANKSLLIPELCATLLGVLHYE
jgi:hypothetical protein